MRGLSGMLLYVYLVSVHEWLRVSAIWIVIKIQRHTSSLISIKEKITVDSFMQWNIRGLNANFEELCLLTKKYKPAVISLQESWLNYDETRSLNWI